MKIDVITAFEEMVDQTLSHSIVGRARKAGIIKLGTLSPRQFTTDKHQTIDDRPYGGGPGMLMKAIGCAVFFSAIVSGIRLIWTWPLRDAKGGNEDGE